jgi:hypothetical protein
VLAALTLALPPGARGEKKKSPGLFDFDTWKAPVTREREAAQQLAPAQLDVTPLGETRAQPIPLRLRVYADRDYRAGMLRWQTKVRAQLDRVNYVVVPLFGVRFEVESLKEWDRSHVGVALEAVLDELQALDGARDVDWVMGLVTPFRGVARNIHQVGMAALSSRHFIMRAMDDAEEGRALDREFAMLAPAERDKLYGDRKAHKELLVFLHEWAHTLGALHVEDPTMIMNPLYDPKQAAFTDFEKRLVELVVERRAGDRSKPFPENAELRRLLEKAPREEGSDAERASMLKFLAARGDGLVADGAGKPAASKAPPPPAPAPALASLEEAMARLKANDVAGATPLVLASARESGSANADTLMRVAAAAATVGAFTTADAALARAGGATAHGKMAGDLEAARARVALPHGAAKLGVGPDDEPRYVAAFWLAIRAVESRNHAAAERRLAELAAAFPDSAGRDVVACELALATKHAADAEKSCRAALAKDPNAVRARLVLGRLAARARHYPEAEKQFRRVLLVDPSDDAAWTELGHLYRAMRSETQHQRLQREYETLFSKPLPQ